LNERNILAIAKCVDDIGDSLCTTSDSWYL